MLLTLMILSATCGGLHIYFDYKNNYPACYLLKPATVIMIMLAVITQTPLSIYDQLILLGLLFSLFGDIFLMLKRQQFIAGLVSFLVAHLLYCAAFSYMLSGPLIWSQLAYFAIPSLVYFVYLLPALGKLKIAVLAYISTIVAMAFLSYLLYQQHPTPYFLAGSIGAVTFMISDATLALNKFRFSFKSAQAIVLSTYYLAQWGIAYSTLQG